MHGADRTGNEKLKYFRERDADYAPVSRRVRGMSVPVYRIPTGMDLLERRRLDRLWSAWLQVAPRFASDMLVLAGQTMPLFLTIDELRHDRRRWVRSIWVATKDPTKEE